MAVSKRTEYIVGGYLMEGIIIFDALTAKEIFKFKPDTAAKVEYIELSYGDSELLVMSTKGDKTLIQLYDFKKLINGEKKIKKIFNFDDTLTQASYGYLNKTLYLSTAKGKMMIVDINTEEKLLEEKVHPGHPIFSFSFSKDFSMLASCGKDGKCKLLHPDTLEVLKIYDKQAPCRCAAFNPLLDMEDTDKYHILIGGGQDARDVTTTAEQAGSFESRLYHIIFEEEMAQIKGHFGPVHSLVICPDGRGFVTASEDGTVR